jgi:hypothetical protein
MATVTTQIELNPIDVADSLMLDQTYDEIINFIMEIDERIADYDFTVHLRDRLTAAIKFEDEAMEDR